MEDSPPPLSDREIELLTELVKGSTNRQIAKALDISPNTVKSHLRNIYEKMGVSSRTEAVAVALQDGLMEDERAPETGVPPLDDGEDEADSIATATPSPSPHTAEALDRPRPPVEQAVPTPLPPARADAAPPRRTMPPWLGIALGTLSLVLLGLLVVMWLRPPAAEAPAKPATVVAVAPQRWEPLAKLPAPRSGSWALTAQSDLLLLGGRNGDSLSVDMWRYDESVGRWEPAAPLPTAVGDAAAAVVSGQLVVVGGVDASGTVVAELQQYDPDGDEWMSGIPLPTPLARAAVAAFEGDLFLFGGTDGTVAQTTIYRLAAGSDGWEPVGELPSPRTDSAAAALEDGIVIVGGQSDEGAALDEVLYFDPLSAEIRDEAPLPDPIAHPRSATLGTALYLLDDGALLERGPQGDWRPLTTPDDLPLPDDAALVARDPYLLVVGGRSDDRATADVWQYQAIYRSFLPLGTSP